MKSLLLSPPRHLFCWGLFIMRQLFVGRVVGCTRLQSSILSILLIPLVNVPFLHSVPFQVTSMILTPT